MLEHTRRPDELLAAFRTHLAPRGTVIASVPNFAHWYPRLRVLSGRFDYDTRGILDRDHVRFFTRRSFEQLAKRSGFAIRRRDAVGLPVEAAHRGGAPTATGNGSVVRQGRAVTTVQQIGMIEKAAVSLWPTLFGFQLLYELEPE